MYLGGQFSKNLRGNSLNKIFEIVRNIGSHFNLRQQKIKLKTVLSGKTRALCKRMFCCIFWQYFYIVITLFAAHSITISNLHLLSISFSLSREPTVTMRTVDVLQFVVLTFGVSAKLKSNAAPAERSN